MTEEINVCKKCKQEIDLLGICGCNPFEIGDF